LTDYNSFSLSSSQKILFYLVTFTVSLILSWLFYDNLFISSLFLPVLQPIQNIYKNHLIKKRKNTLLLQFKDLLYSLSSLVTVGRSVGQALEDSLEFMRGTYDDSDYIICELNYMTRLMSESRESDISVLEDFAERTSLDDIRDFAAACKICKETGSNMTKAISNTSNIIGDKISLEKELQTAVAQKKFEGRIVAIAPFVMIFTIKIFSPEYLKPLILTAEGRMISTLALVMIVVSWLLIERMNKIEF